MLHATFVAEALDWALHYANASCTDDLSAYSFSGRCPLASLLQLDDRLGLLMPAQVMTQQVLG